MRTELQAIEKSVTNTPYCRDAMNRVFFLPIIYIAQIIPSFLGWQLHQCKAIIT
ncbi:MAG: hypothetical protein RMX35_06905 [Nostoc sp. DcaGUA01]|nr:hypothetical protein [Nostoc sp. DcaGUA01]